jgi:inner membrane transporter RhtA
MGATLAGDAGRAAGWPGWWSSRTALRAAGQGVPAPLLLVAAILSIQCGAAASTALFDSVGVVGAAFARTVAAALILLVLARPQLRGRSRRDLAVVLVFGVQLALMMVLFLAAIERLPLAVVVTLEFLGPLGVALLGSRRPLDLLWVALALGGVVLFAGDPTAADGDWLGMAMALAAGALWGSYILMAQRVGRRWEGSQGLAVSMAVVALLLAPVGIAQGGADLLDPGVMLLAAGVGVLAGALPFALELAALRRMAARTYGVLVSLEPAVAALVGLVALSQMPRVAEAVAVLLVVAASIGATRAASPPTG